MMQTNAAVAEVVSCGPAQYEPMTTMLLELHHDVEI